VENIINDQFVLGIDIGGSKIRLGLVDVNGEVAWSITKPNFNFETISEWIEYFKNEIMNQIPPKLIYSYSKIGIGAAGWIDQTTHIIIHSPNTNWTNIKNVIRK
jgi:predicted NBD/HSP70 family sugar kinase